MKPKAITKETIIITILIAGLLGLYSLDRGRLGHSIPDEKRYIQSTEEMVESGDYVTPRYHGELRFQKPILFYSLIVLSYKLFGVGIFGARFPSIIAALLNVILIYLLGRDLFSKKAGIFSALILSTSEIYFMYSRFATPDITFLLFINVSIYLFVKAYLNDIKGRFKYLYMYVPMALAMLTKGPLGFLYPMAVVCLFLIFKRDWAVFKELRFPLGFLVFAVISAPWFIVMIILHGSEYLGKVWTLEIMKKLKYFSSGTGDNLLVHYFNTALYYSGIGFIRHLPWSAFLPASLVSIPKLTSVRTKRDCGFALMSAWFLTVFVSLVLIWSRESYYALGFSIPFSLFMGVYFSEFTRDDNLSNGILFKLPFVFSILISLVALSLWLWFLVYILDKQILSFSLFMLAVPIVVTLVYFGKNKSLLPLSFFIASFASFAYFAGYIVPIVDEEPLLAISRKIEEAIKPGDIVGVASSEVSYHRLNISLKDYDVLRVDKYYIDESGKKCISEDKKKLISEFLSTEEKRIFCVITKDDYYKYVDETLRNKIYVMDKTFIWKKFHKQDKEYFKRLLSYFLEGKRELLKQALKEEIYLVSNNSSPYGGRYHKRLINGGTNGSSW